MIWLLCVILLLLAVLVRRQYSSWSRRGFPEISPSIPLGNLGAVVSGKKSVGVQLHDLYFQSQAPMVGIYLFFKPALLLRDPELIKRVLVTDFEHFHDRGVHYDEENDPVGANLLGMPGQKWKRLREKFSPIFTGSKLRNMYPVIEEQTHILRDYLKGQIGNEVPLKTLIYHSNVNIVASIFFGFDLNCFETPNHEFRLIGDKFLSTGSLRNKLVQGLFFMSPLLMKFLRLSLLQPDVSEYILNLVHNIFALRRSEKVRRNDLIQIFMAMMDAEENDPSLDPADKMTITKCAAESFVFYMAGSETSSSAISFCLHELSRRPDLMDAVRQEIDPVMVEYQGNIPYEKVAEFKFLNMCITETLRMYPGLPFLSRECTKEYKVPNSNWTIEKGTPILIPNFGVQRDPKYYPDPGTFDPYRFDDDLTVKESPYYPWGIGPRSCIGIRLGNLVVRLALINLIYNYDFIPSSTEVEFDPKALALSEKNGVMMTIKERKRD